MLADEYACWHFRDGRKRKEDFEPWKLKLALLKEAPESIQQTDGWLEAWILSRMQVPLSSILDAQSICCWYIAQCSEALI